MNVSIAIMIYVSQKTVNKSASVFDYFYEKHKDLLSQRAQEQARRIIKTSMQYFNIRYE